MHVELGPRDPLFRIVELLRLGEMGDIAGVNHESGLWPKSADLGDRLLQRAERVGIGRLVEPDMAV